MDSAKVDPSHPTTPSFPLDSRKELLSTQPVTATLPAATEGFVTDTSRFSHTSGVLHTTGVKANASQRYSHASDGYKAPAFNVTEPEGYAYAIADL